MNIISIVFRKELKDMFRDRKTVIAAILIPFLLYPLLFGFMGKGIKDNMDFVEKGFEITLIDDGNSALGEEIKNQPNISFKESEDILEDVRSGKLLLGLEIPKDFDQVLEKENQINVILTYDGTSQKSSTVRNIITSIIDDFSKDIINQRLESKNIDISILNPIETVIETPEKEDNAMGKLMLSLLLPMMLIMFAATGPIASATDLGAGEKERGTLEPLLTTQANRISLLWGKFLAITVMGVATSISFIAGLFLSMRISPEAFVSGIEGVEFGLELNSLLVIGLLTVLMTMVFGGLALAISIYARSFKEAQTYLTPLTLIGMLGFSSYFIEPKTMSSVFLHIPIVNVVALIKELTLGIFNIGHFLIVLLWIFTYIAFSIAFARYMFTKEEVIFRT